MVGTCYIEVHLMLTKKVDGVPWYLCDEGQAVVRLGVGVCIVGMGVGLGVEVGVVGMGIGNCVVGLGVEVCVVWLGVGVCVFGLGVQLGVGVVTGVLAGVELWGSTVS